MSLFFLYFFYGLAFFVLGLLLTTNEVPNALLPYKRAFLLWGIFGLLHGVNEWVVMVQLPPIGMNSPSVALTGHALSGVSFAALFHAAAQSVKVRRPALGRALLLICIAASALWMSALALEAYGLIPPGFSDIAARWLLGAPGALVLGFFILEFGLATLRFGLVDQAVAKAVRDTATKPFNLGFVISGVGLVLYAAVTVFTDQAALVGAPGLTATAFQSFCELPVPIPRSLCAVAMAVGVMISFREFHVFRQRSLEQDIQTATRRMRDAIEVAEESRQRFKDFAEAASEWFWSTDADDRFTVITYAQKKVSHIDESEFIGSRRLDLTTEDTNTYKWKVYRETLANRKFLTDFEYAVWTKENGEQYVRINGKPFFDKDGDFQGYRGTARNITDETALRVRNRELFQRMQNAFQSVTVGIVMTEQDGRIFEFNPAAERIFGYKISEVIGENVSILMTGQHSQAHDSYMGRYIGGGKARIMGTGRELLARHKDGREIPIHLGIDEIKEQHGSIFIGSITDLSIMKGLEEKIRHSQKMDAVGELTGGIAHDFNNLLGIAIGNLGMAKRKADPESPLLKYIDKALTANQRGADLTRRLLNFSRSSPTQTETVKINDLVRDLNDLIGRSLTAQATVTLELDPAAGKVTVHKGDLEDALINLVLNARDAMTNGGELKIATAEVLVLEESNAEFNRLEPGYYVQIEVSDNGVGMPANVARKVFDPFFTTKDQGKGSGLGLSMVYGFVKRSGGDVSVHSEEGVGTTFKILLPTGGTPSAPSNTKTVEPIPAGQNESILVVDDESDLLEVAVSMLQDLGYTATGCEQAQRALELLNHDAGYDLLLTDIVMPGEMNGLDLVNAAKTAHPNLKVLVASGYASQSVWDESSHSWKGMMINKPYNQLALSRAVRTALDGGP